jgi:heme/copper-type cytochrome/quinol oxidase subunit 4
LGICVTAFNLFIFGNPNPQTHSTILTENGYEKNKYLINFNLVMSCIRQAPFLLGLLLLGVGVILFSKLDTFIVLSREIGGKAIHYVFIVSGVVFAVATVFGFIWIFMKYKLEKMKCRYEYKRDVMTNLGLLVIDDNILINNEGQVITRDEAKKRILEKSPLLISRQNKQ